VLRAGDIHGSLRLDASGLQNANSFFRVSLLDKLVQEWTRAQTTDEDNGLRPASVISCKYKVGKSFILEGESLP